MQYIERLLQKQAQMAARLERQSAPTLRLYPDEVWLDLSKTAQAAEREADAAGAESSQETAAAEVYRQLVHLEAAQDRRTQTMLHQVQQTLGVMPRADAAPDAAVGLRQRTDEPVQEVQRQVFSLPHSQTSQVSMERISRFFERDARRYGG